MTSTPRTVRLLAIGALGLLLAVTLLQPVPASNADYEADLPVDVVYAPLAGAPDGALPHEAALETAHLLRDVGGMRRVALLEADDAATLLSLVAGSHARFLVVLGHGEAAGLRAGGTLVPWSQLRDAIAGSFATDVFLGACDSSRLDPIPGKTIRTSFEGEVDAGVVAPSIANDLFEQVLVDRDAAFVPAFLDYVKAHGGLKRYAQLMLFPERPMGDPDMSACDKAVKDFYSGRNVDTADQDCIIYINPGSTNCYAADAQSQDPCDHFTADDQQKAEDESAPSADVQYGDGSSSSAAASPAGSPQASTNYWFDAVARKLNVEVKHPDGSTDAVEIEYGPVEHDSCVTIVTLSDLTSGGMTAILRAILDNIRSSAGSNGAISANSDSSIGLRICGDFHAVIPALTTQRPSHTSVVATFDIRVSGRSYISIQQKVFRWTITIDIGVEGGIKYPIEFDISGDITNCSSDWSSLINWSGRLDVPWKAGGATIFGYGMAGYKEIGYEHDFGANGSGSFSFWRNCNGQWGFNAGSSDARLAPIPANDPLLGPTLQRLVDAGAATLHAQPTVLYVQPDGTAVTLKSGFVPLVPGTGQWNGLAAKGGLAKLGIPADLPASRVALVDLTNPRVAEVMGVNPGNVVPEVTLNHDGVVILPASTPVDEAQEAFCAAPAKYPALEAATCAGLDFGPLRPASAAAVSCLPVRPDVYAGPHFDDQGLTVGSGVPGLCADTSGVFDAANQPTGDAREQACDNALVTATCAYTRVRESAEGAATPLGLATQIHDVFQILDRPAYEVGTLIEKCTAAVDGVRPEDAIQPWESELSNTGAEYLGTCAGVGGWSGTTPFDVQTVALQFAEGQNLLALYAADTPNRAVDSQQNAPPAGVPNVVDPAYETVCQNAPEAC